MPQNVLQRRIPVSMSYKTRYICLSFIFVCIMMLNFQRTHAQTFGSLDALVEKQKKNYGGKMAVMVWKDTIVYKKLVGEDMSLNTQVPIGCASAWLTAA